MHAGTNAGCKNACLSAVCCDRRKKAAVDAFSFLPNRLMHRRCCRRRLRRWRALLLLSVRLRMWLRRRALQNVCRAEWMRVELLLLLLLLLTLAHLCFGTLQQQSLLQLTFVIACGLVVKEGGRAVAGSSR